MNNEESLSLNLPLLGTWSSFAKIGTRYFMNYMVEKGRYIAHPGKSTRLNIYLSFISVGCLVISLAV